MTWLTALQTFSASLAAIGAWFLFDLAKEFKDFKRDTKNDVTSLKNERLQFQTTVRNAELTISLRVSDMQKIHNEFSLKVQERLIQMRDEIDRAKAATNDIIKKAESLDQFMEKSFRLSRALNERIKHHDQAIEQIQIKMGETTVFKSRK